MHIMQRASEMGDERDQQPITSVIIVADKSKCPRGFSPITRAYDDQSDADLWKEGGFTSLWSRPVRYIAISRETPANSLGAHVVVDLCIMKENDPVPRGFTAIDYTADSKEKSLRKRCLCVRTVPRDSTVDAVGEIVVLNRMKRPPNNFSSAGEVDGALICFRHIVIPSTFGLAIPERKQEPLYPSVCPPQAHQSDPQLNMKSRDLPEINVLTIRAGDVRKNIKDIPFKLHPVIENGLVRENIHSLPDVKRYTREMLDELYKYEFTLERDAVRNL